MLEMNDVASSLAIGSHRLCPWPMLILLWTIAASVNAPVAAVVVVVVFDP